MATDRLEKERIRALGQIRRQALATRRLELTEVYFKMTGGAVQAGPFAGMKLVNDADWGDGDTLPKLIGCYEAELHPAIDAFLAAAPKRLVNVGSAEGYYTVGLLRRLPAATATAFETSDKSRGIGQQAAELNGVADRLTSLGTCDLPALAGALEQPALLVMDCEGGELTLLDPTRVPGLARCDILVECHDFASRNLTKTLVARLGPTHQIERVEEGARDPNKNAWLRRLNSMDRWLAVNERRPETMHWLVCHARS